MPPDRTVPQARLTLAWGTNDRLPPSRPPTQPTAEHPERTPVHGPSPSIAPAAPASTCPGSTRYRRPRRCQTPRTPHPELRQAHHLAERRTRSIRRSRGVTLLAFLTPIHRPRMSFSRDHPTTRQTWEIAPLASR